MYLLNLVNNTGILDSEIFYSGAETGPERACYTSVHAGLHLGYSRKSHPVGRALHWPADDKQCPSMVPLLQACLSKSRSPGQSAPGINSSFTTRF